MTATYGMPPGAPVTHPRSAGGAVPFAPGGAASAQPTPRPPSPRVRGLATAQEIAKHVAQRLGREGERLGFGGEGA